MNFGTHRLDIDWGHLLLLAGFATFVVWYYEDAQNASIEIENTILIVPATVMALVLCAFVALQTIRISRIDEPQRAPLQAVAPNSDPKTASIVGPVCYMVALGIYVFILEMIGFDVATAAFVAAAMVISGERRPHVIVGFSIVFAALCVYALKLVLPLHLPTLFF